MQRHTLLILMHLNKKLSCLIAMRDRQRIYLRTEWLMLAFLRKEVVSRKRDTVCFVGFRARLKETEGRQGFRGECF